MTGDPDIGMCDLCGSEEGNRIPRRETHNISQADGTSAPEVITVWKCEECR